MFDNEIDWVKNYKAEQAYPHVRRHEEQYRKFMSEGMACLVECL
jgi:hypothetical protein